MQSLDVSAPVLKIGIERRAVVGLGGQLGVCELDPPVSLGGGGRRRAAARGYTLSRDQGSISAE
jgi:hypothetical protein